MLGGLAFAGVRGLQAWRTLRRFRRRLTDGLAGMTQRLAAAERRLAQAGESAQRFDKARADLARSLATARMLAEASEAKTLIELVRPFVARR